MQLAKDPVLNMLANSVDDLTCFQSALSGRADLKLKSCYFSAVSRKWEVKLYLGGTQRIIGRTRSAGTGARFADAAQLHFWKFRRNVTRDPLDCDLNFSVDSARADLANNSPLLKILTGIESYLIDEKGLVLPVRRVTKQQTLTATTEQLQKQLWLAWNKFEAAANEVVFRLSAKEESKIVRDIFSDNVSETKKILKSVNHWLIQPVTPSHEQSP